MKNKVMNANRFNHIKKLLSQEGATVEGVARQAKASWDTVRKVSRVSSFAEYKGVPVEQKTPETVSLRPANLVEQLKEQQTKMNEHFNAVIAHLQRKQ